MKATLYAHVFGRFVAALVLLLCSGCSGLLPSPLPPDSIYLLESGAAPQPVYTPRSDAVLAVSLPRARAGFDTAQMVWVQQAHGLRVYSRSRWADTPSHLLAPLISQAVVRSGAFHAVVQAPSSVSALLRLDTELIRLQQDFSVQPSRVRLTLAAQLIDQGARRVLAAEEFDETENASSEDAYGGVRASF